MESNNGHGLHSIKTILHVCWIFGLINRLDRAPIQHAAARGQQQFSAGHNGNLKIKGKYSTVNCWHILNQHVSHLPTQLNINSKLHTVLRTQNRWQCLVTVGESATTPHSNALSVHSGDTIPLHKLSTQCHSALIHTVRLPVHAVHCQAETGDLFFIAAQFGK